MLEQGLLFVGEFFGEEQQGRFGWPKLWWCQLGEEQPKLKLLSGRSKLWWWQLGEEQPKLKLLSGWSRLKSLKKDKMKDMI